MYEKLISFGIGKKSQKILDLGSGTAVLPTNLHHTGAVFTATDISENQIEYGKKITEEKCLKNISFKVCSAENIGFADNSFDVVTAVQCFQYFNSDKASKEIHRVLKPEGLFMDWLPQQDNVIAEMEQTVLKYSPDWNGCGFEKFRYSYPVWAENDFNIDTIHSYDVSLNFTKEEWLGRVMSCRGVGARLSEEKLREFEAEYRSLLDKYESEILSLKHQIHIEIYKAK